MLFCSPEMVIAGVTGGLYAGKEEFVGILSRVGFKWLSFRKVIETRAIERGLEPTMENLQLIGEEERKMGGTDPWCVKLLDDILLNGGTDKNYVIGVFKYSDQVEFFNSRLGKDFYLVAIDSPPDKRFRRARADYLSRYGTNLTREDFEIMDCRDWEGYKEGNGQNVEGCFNLTAHHIDNSGNQNALEGKACAFLQMLREGSIEPFNSQAPVLF